MSSIEVARRGLAAIFTDRFGWMHVQSPLHYLLVWLSLLPADPASTAVFVHLPSALAGTLTPLIVYCLGRELFGRWQGTLAAVLMAFSTVFLDYSLDLRPYAMLTLLTIFSVYSLLVAERTGSTLWWLAFAIAGAANVLNAYVALALVMPALAPYLAWVLRKLWRARGQVSNGRRKSPLPAVMAIVTVALASVVMLADAMQTPRNSPDLHQLSLLTPVTAVLELLSWFGQFGLEGQAERGTQLLLVLLALAGAYSAYRAGGEARRGLALCGLFIAIPPSILAVLSTTNAVFQRYALFTLPFYFLLIAQGLAALASALAWERAPAVVHSWGHWLGVGAAAAVVALFTLGALHYYGQDTRAQFSYRPDFRGVSQYLSEKAVAGDVVVFVGWDSNVSDFYWHGTPPLPVYSARDPLLFQVQPTGSIYWVIDSAGQLTREALGDPGLSEIKGFQQLVVLKESRPKYDMASAVERLAAIFRHASPTGELLFNTLSGCAAQARGDVAGAAEAYRRAGIYFLSMPEEYLSTAQGFAQRGDLAHAWRDTLLSKGWEPGSVELHRWMAELLARMGHQRESQAETTLVQALQNSH